MITVFGRATSSNVQAVMWGIGELGLEYERLDYGHVYGGLDSPEFMAISPHALVPAVRDSDLEMFESCAILRYLGGRYGDAPFWPKDPAARARVDIWAEWSKLNFCTDFTTRVFLPKIRTAAKDRDVAALALGIANFETRLDRLEAQLEKHDYVASADFTMADIVIGSVLFRWFDMDVVRQPRPLVQDYYSRLKDRPAYREHVMISYESLRADGA